MSREALNPDELTRRLAPLLAAGQAVLAELDLQESLLLELGFEVSEGRARVPAGVERLDRSAIVDALDDRARRWLSDLVAQQVVGSTSTELNELARVGSVHGVVRLAELQIQGRGRRGRSWHSPYANNLALSLGARMPQTPDRLGGFSLCMGLAVADCLESLGVVGVALKWPNDVLVGGRKIAGVLVELHPSREGSEVVVGVGINFRLPAQAKAGIDQPVTDLAETGHALSRNRVAGALISSMVDFIEGFSERGFDPMTGVFDGLHHYHGEICSLLLGPGTLTGRVRGVTKDGALLLEIDGAIRPFNAGEVSLRPA